MTFCRMFWGVTRQPLRREFVSHALIGALCAAMMALPSIAQASFPGRNGNLAAELPDSDSCGGSYVRLFNSDGGDLGPLTPRCDTSLEPRWTTLWAWSPDGQRLLIERSEPLGYLTIAADGSDPRPIPALRRFDELCARWERVRRRRIEWLFDLEGDARRHPVSSLPALTCPRWCRAGERIVVWWPLWSPDGKTIAFVATWESSEKGGPEGIWLISARTGKLVLSMLDGLQFDWAPNSKRIVYRAENGDLWTVGVNGRRAKRIVRGDEWPQSRPTWSPDGRWIAWTKAKYSFLNDSSASVTASLWRVRARGGDSRRVRVLLVGHVYTDDEVGAPDIAWQPLP